MATANKNSGLPTTHTKTNQPKKVIVMRKNQKVASISLCCKLNMLVPQLKSLNARMQQERNDKARNPHTSN
ncbi:hypothetical protein DP923_10340 [Pontibacter arcticus]|uniref:Uncharacterized protein n=1 Tax=Pontibacter arcticus TaxID=2080288 RepID=A0A364RD26_9BACT|nr:hypothetical protein DP923_10340 [Pontibacter arcticus]